MFTFWRLPCTNCWVFTKLCREMDLKVDLAFQESITFSTRWWCCLYFGHISLLLLSFFPCYVTRVFVSYSPKKISKNLSILLIFSQIPYPLSWLCCLRPLFQSLVALFMLHSPWVLSRATQPSPPMFFPHFKLASSCWYKLTLLLIVCKFEANFPLLL